MMTHARSLIVRLMPSLASILLAACASQNSTQSPPAHDQAQQPVAQQAAQNTEPVLRVCADPNNLPFSNAAGEGFENRLAQLVADQLGAKVEYTWWAQRRGFIRNTLKEKKCDVVMGVPTDYDLALTTRPYYRSSYVFVYRKKNAYDLQSIDDPRLTKLKIGVHAIGSDNPPPALALAQRGIVHNVVGYSIYGDYRSPNPPARLIDAVADGDVDVAIAWGPLAGYFAARSDTPLTIMPIAEQAGAPLPFQFSISMGVRRDDKALKARLDSIIQQKQADINALLRRYDVPLVDTSMHVARMTITH
jgi:quinoprotein dehydrogenase-associated probable ABC transporter substrate-binding protein